MFFSTFHCTLEKVPISDCHLSSSPSFPQLHPPLPLALWGCCVHRAGMMASVCRSMRPLLPVTHSFPAPSLFTFTLFLHHHIFFVLLLLFEWVSSLPFFSDASPSLSQWQLQSFVYCQFPRLSIFDPHLVSTRVQHSGYLLCKSTGQLFHMAFMCPHIHEGNNHYGLCLKPMSNVYYSRTHKAITLSNETGGKYSSLKQWWIQRCPCFSRIIFFQKAV